MAAATGTKRTIPFKVNVGTKVGQGIRPELVARVSFSDISAYPIVWTDITSKVRSFSISRGGDSEQQDTDAGTATLVVSNTDRLFDPSFNTSARPMNQLWILEQFSGETQSLFKGYVEKYDQEWRDMTDAVATITAADEFKLLARGKLPVMNPPEDSYQALVQYDEPDGYWPLNDDVLTQQVSAVTGSSLEIANYITPQSDTAIVGDNGGPTGVGSYDFPNGSRVFEGSDNNEGVSGDASGLPEMTLEFWFKNVNGLAPISLDYFATGPSDGVEEQYRIGINSSLQIDFFARDHAANTYEFTAGTLNRSDIFYHVVCTIQGNYMRTYVNGVEAGNLNWASYFTGIDPAGTPFRIGSTGNSRTWRLDEVAFYRHGLTAARVAAHYEAGTARGLAARTGSGLIANNRVNDLLDVADSRAPRAIQDSTRSIRAIFFKGQAPLTELREVTRCELIDGMLFVAADGTVTFLNNGHNSAAPYTTVQVVYGDGGGSVPNQRPYVDVDFDYSDSFITNRVDANRVTGLLQTKLDQFSIDRYGLQAQTVSDLEVGYDSEAASIADSIVGRWKAPQQRILSLGLITSDPDLTLETFRLELGARIRLIRSVTGGILSREMFVRKIDVNGGPDGLWSIRLGVSDATVTLGPAGVLYADFNALIAAYPTSFDALAQAQSF